VVGKEPMAKARALLVWTGRLGFPVALANDALERLRVEGVVTDWWANKMRSGSGNNGLGRDSD
jgi:hypothetical protein